MTYFGENVPVPVRLIIGDQEADGFYIVGHTVSCEEQRTASPGADRDMESGLIRMDRHMVITETLELRKITYK